MTGIGSRNIQRSVTRLEMLVKYVTATRLKHLPGSKGFQNFWIGRHSTARTRVMVNTHNAMKVMEASTIFRKIGVTKVR